MHDQTVNNAQYDQANRLAICILSMTLLCSDFAFVSCESMFLREACLQHDLHALAVTFDCFANRDGLYFFLHNSLAFAHVQPSSARSIVNSNLKLCRFFHKALQRSVSSCEDLDQSQVSARISSLPQPVCHKLHKPEARCATLGRPYRICCMPGLRQPHPCVLLLPSGSSWHAKQGHDL